MQEAGRSFNTDTAFKRCLRQVSSRIALETLKTISRAADSRNGLRPEALRWCSLAADQGHGGAVFVIGRLYHTAHGVTQDIGASTYAGTTRPLHMGITMVKRESSCGRHEPSQIADEQKLAREWNVRMRALQS